MVPNPYVVSSILEQQPYLQGRGERFIRFINLPSECTIRIFTINGDLVRSLVHSGLENGSIRWDLKTKDGLEVAFGFYLFHVDAPSIGEYTGKFAARLDDILNYIPARLAGVLLVVSAYIARKNGRKAWRTLLSDHGKTSSPNAGWTMAASAGALDIRLEKPGHYRLGNTGGEPGPSSISGGLQLMVLTCLLWCCICIGIMGARYGITA